MRDAIDQYIIDRVREIRTKKRISQSKLAYALGYDSVSYIGAIESLNPIRTECYNSKQLNKIAIILECSPKDFWPDLPITSYISPRTIRKRVKSRLTKP